MSNTFVLGVEIYVSNDLNVKKKKSTDRDKS